MVRYKRRWSVIYEGDVKLHTSCDVPAPFNQFKTTVVDGARSRGDDSLCLPEGMIFPAKI